MSVTNNGLKEVTKNDMADPKKKILSVTNSGLKQMKIMKVTKYGLEPTNNDMMMSSSTSLSK